MNNLSGTRLRAKRPAHLTFSQEMQKKALESQGFALSLPYWSTVRFQFTRSGAGPYTFTLVSADVVAFSYGLGDAAPASAGFAASGLTMTLAETNLQTRHETIAGEELHIRGLGIQPCAGSDGALTSLIWRNTAAVLSLNGGTTRIPLGPLALLPGGGGLTGAGPDVLATQPIPGGRPSFSNLTNGWPVRKNLMPLPEGFVWRNKSRRDGQLAVILQPASRALAVTTPADEAAAAGIRGYNYPGSAFVDVLVWADGQARSKRSRLI